MQGDSNTVNRAVATMLKTWGIPEEDIQAVRDEAENVKKRRGKHDKAKDALWPRVEMRAPANGVIIERNLALHEIVVDNTTNLFQIADVDKLFIAANVPEDDLPELEALRQSIGRSHPWTVKTVGSDPIPGYIDDIGYIIDPNQHTAVVQGLHRQQGGEAAGRAIRLGHRRARRRPTDVVEVPIEAPWSKTAAKHRLRADRRGETILHDAARAIDAALREDGLRPQQARWTRVRSSRPRKRSSACCPRSRCCPASASCRPAWASSKRLCSTRESATAKHEGHLRGPADEREAASEDIFTWAQTGSMVRKLIEWALDNPLVVVLLAVALAVVGVYSFLQRQRRGLSRPGAGHHRGGRAVPRRLAPRRSSGR